MQEVSTEWRLHRKKGLTEMRPWTEADGDKRTMRGLGISVSDEDTPGPGGMIARNSHNHQDRWYVDEKYFERNYEEAGASSDGFKVFGDRPNVLDSTITKETDMPQFTDSEICNRITYHPPKTEGDVQAHDRVRNIIGDAMRELNALCPDGRDKALAFTKLEEAMFHANAALARARGASA